MHAPSVITILIGEVLTTPAAFAANATFTLVEIVTPFIVKGAVITGADWDVGHIPGVVCGIVIKLIAGAVFAID